MELTAFLFAMLSLVTALIWQISPRRGREITFGVADAVDFIADRLPAEVRDRLRASGIRRIVEWEVYYLQGLAQRDVRTPVEVVAGDYIPAVDFIRDQISQRHGLEYSQHDTRQVLNLGADYLASIGAVGERVEVLDDDG